jgi:hypothetical protein
MNTYGGVPVIGSAELRHALISAGPLRDFRKSHDQMLTPKALDRCAISANHMIKC